MALTSSDLVGYHRAEFARSAILRVWLFALQLAVALPVAISVVIPDKESEYLYWLALSGFLLLVGWWAVSDRYSRARDAAQAARRGALLLGGLNEPLSAGEVQSLRECFTVSEQEAQRYKKSDYYASQRAPGPARLGEMLEESAFYSERLQGISANVMMWVVLGFVVLSIAITFGITPYVSRDTSHTIVRAFLALLVFGMSSDVFGAFLAHRKAARAIRNVRQRLAGARGRREGGRLGAQA